MKITFNENDIKSLIAEKYDVSTDEITFVVEKQFSALGDEEYTVSVEVQH